MPIEQLVDIPEAISSPSTQDIFVLAKSTYEFRVKNNVSIGKNVASVLLSYNGMSFAPTTSDSGSARALASHGERTALVYSIKNAVTEKWGPFKDFVGDANAITAANVLTNLSLIESLKQLDSIKISSERAFCNYSRNPQSGDSGCLPYFRDLENLIGENRVYLIHNIPKFVKESEAQTKLSANIKTLQSPEAIELFRLRQSIIVRMAEIEQERQLMEKEIRDKLTPLLSAQKSASPDQKDALSMQIRDTQIIPRRGFMAKHQQEIYALNKADIECCNAFRNTISLPLISLPPPEFADPLSTVERADYDKTHVDGAGLVIPHQKRDRNSSENTDTSLAHAATAVLAPDPHPKHGVHKPGMKITTMYNQQQKHASSLQDLAVPDAQAQANNTVAVKLDTPSNSSHALLLLPPK